MFVGAVESENIKDSWSHGCIGKWIKIKNVKFVSIREIFSIYSFLFV